MTAFEIIIFAILYIAMFGFILQNRHYNANDEISVTDVFVTLLLAWAAPAIFAMYIHQCITKFLDT